MTQRVAAGHARDGVPGFLYDRSSCGSCSCNALTSPTRSGASNSGVTVCGEEAHCAGTTLSRGTVEASSYSPSPAGPQHPDSGLYYYGSRYYTAA